MRNRGQSAVVGVVLLVALTIVLATTVGTFAFGLGSDETNGYSPVDSDLGQTAPASQGERSAAVIFSIDHISEKIPEEEVEIIVDGERVEDRPGLHRTDKGADDGFGAGDSIVVNQTDRTAFHAGVEVQVVRVQGDRGTLLDELTLEGRNVSIGSFGFSYYTLANFDDGKLCARYSGSEIDASRLSIEAYDGTNWVSASSFYGNSFDVDNLVSTGQNKINTPSKNLGDDDLRVVYHSINGDTVLYEEQNINYNPC